MARVTFANQYSLITKGSFPKEYIPTVFDNYAADVDLDGQTFTVGFFDTAGQEVYDRLRPLSYPGADAIVISFAIDSPASLEDVQEKVVLRFESLCILLTEFQWRYEIEHFCRGVPLFLIGCKKDLRHDHQRIGKLHKQLMKPVTVEQVSSSSTARRNEP